MHKLLKFIIPLVLMACQEKVVIRDEIDDPNEGNKAPVVVYADPNLIAIEAASEGLCLSGGHDFVSYIDANRNGLFDAGEEEKSRSTVCNGVNGANGTNGSNGTNGYGAGILVEAASALACVAGGSTLRTFVDRNNNALQESDEITTSLSTICNGSDGNDGTNGIDGQPATITASLASFAQCAEGGVVYTTFSGGQSVPNVNIVCNGRSGANGSNGSDGEDGEDAGLLMGAVGEAVKGKNYSACHHDFLYFPDSSGGSRGWLTFRHQKNGSEDQGIGSTGFQIWNVDITHFSLVSEVGGHRYCDLTWDAERRVLDYTVVDSDDGLEGSKGSIDLNK